MNKLYCFGQEDIDEYMKRVTRMKEQGLDELIVSLEKGLKHQNELFVKWTKKEPTFATNLAAFAGKTAKGIISEFEEFERSSAEDILNEIK